MRRGLLLSAHPQHAEVPIGVLDLVQLDERDRDVPALHLGRIRCRSHARASVPVGQSFSLPLELDHPRKKGNSLSSRLLTTSIWMLVSE